MKKLIYAVEDDAALRELYTYALENDFDCRTFACGEEFFRADGKPDLVLLDVMLPGEDGFALLARLKADAATARIPVLMVSAKGDELSKVKGLNLGADDYITKPFGVLELRARIRANLRKQPADADIAAFKDITVDGARHRVIINGKETTTTLKEYNLLLLLCQNAETVLPREIIFAEVWGEGFVGESRTLDIHINTLRKKLTEAESAAEIKTLRAIGYMLA